MSLLRLSSLLILASALTACTRPEGESVKLSISIPSKVSSFSAGSQSQQSIGTLTATPSPTPAPTEALVHVVVNITGGGYDRIREDYTLYPLKASVMITPDEPYDRLIADLKNWVAHYG